MKFRETYFDLYENKTSESVFIGSGLIKVNPGSKIIESTFSGPAYINRFTQIGPLAKVGKYFGMNESCYVARAEIGSYCSFGARTAINPFNHPVDWLSINEFQYHPLSFNWVDEYVNINRMERTPDMLPRVRIGNDVWTGHNVNIMSGVNVGDGAIIGAGSVVTKDVPAYAVVAGVPAKIIRYRFSEEVIEKLLQLKWWDLDISSLSGLPFNDINKCIDLISEIKNST